jgi:hypothetical protein
MGPPLGLGLKAGPPKRGEFFSLKEGVRENRVMLREDARQQL